METGCVAMLICHPRMVLQVFVAKGFPAKKRGIDLLDPARLIVVTRGSEQHLDAVEDRRGRERLVYKAKKRESFEKIGKKIRPHSPAISPASTTSPTRPRSSRAKKSSYIE